jgi:2-methylcitrate dehydratase PrpD
MERVDFGVNADAEAAGFDKMTTIIEVELDDGTVVKGAADFGKGSPANPMSDDELQEKFRQCAAWGRLDGAQMQTVIDLVWRIETLDDVGELMRHLRIKRME